MSLTPRHASCQYLLDLAGESPRQGVEPNPHPSPQVTLHLTLQGKSPPEASQPAPLSKESGTEMPPNSFPFRIHFVSVSILHNRDRLCLFVSSTYPPLFAPTYCSFSVAESLSRSLMPPPILSLPICLNRAKIRVSSAEVGPDTVPVTSHDQSLTALDTLIV